MDEASRQPESEESRTFRSLWQYRIKPLFSRGKLPGWFFIVYVIFKEVADFHSRITFWFQAVKGMDEYFGYLASVLASPWFDLGLLVFGILWLIFVGESRRPLRHPLWPVLGWAVFIVVALAFWSVLVAGYALVHAPQQSGVEITKRVDERVAERLRPRMLTEDQREKLIEALNNVPLGETYKLTFAILPNCDDCPVYADDLMMAWKSVPRWDVAGTTHFGLNPRLSGIFFIFDPYTCPLSEIELIRGALRTASVESQFNLISDKDKKVLSEPCNVIVGSKPQK